MELSGVLFMIFALVTTQSQGASLLGTENYYKVLSIGSVEMQDVAKGRKLMYMKSDYNQYSLQEVQSRISVSCYVKAIDIDGEVYTATCPAGCNHFASQVWGSGVYLADSSFCAAAVHDGIITAEHGGAVTVRKIEGKPSYKGTTHNGITSKTYGQSNCSFIFQNAGKARRPTYEISCIVQSNWIKETDFNVVCPAGCSEVIEKLWGNGTYSDDSYICAAAIHDGKVEASVGGEVHVIKSGFQSTFDSVERNGITSKQHTNEQESFTLEVMMERTSSVLEVSCYFRADHVKEEVFSALCPPGCDSVSDQVYGTGIYTQDSFLCASAIHAGRIHATMGGMVTIFKTSGNIEFVGSQVKGITSMDSEYGNMTSFIFQDSTIRQPAIVKVSCELRGDHLRDDVATVICPGDCDHRSYEVWGEDTYKSDSYICASAAHAGLIDVSLGGPVTVKRVGGLESYEGSTRQRIISKPFGQSSTAFAFADNIQKVGSVLAVTCDFTAELINDDFVSLKCPVNCADGKSKVWGDGIYTSDSPICLAAIHNGLIQGSIGGKITMHKVQGRAKYGAAKRNEIQSFEYGSWSSASIVFQRPCVETEPLYPVTCETRANFMVDDAFIVVCPAGCDVEESEIWGTGVYTDDSYVCGAAIHDGRLSADVGGQIMVGKVPGLQTYTGSLQNDIESRTKGKWRKSIVFQDAIVQHTSTFTISCDVEANMVLDDRYSVICPPGCEEETERVWGTDVYTEDSYICAAAIHAGKIKAQFGGHVMVKRTDATHFFSTTRNGVESKPYDKTTKAWRFI